MRPCNHEMGAIYVMYTMPYRNANRKGYAALTLGLQLPVNASQSGYPNFGRRGGKGGLDCGIVQTGLGGTVRTMGTMGTIRKGFSHFCRRMGGLWTLSGGPVKCNEQRKHSTYSDVLSLNFGFLAAVLSLLCTRIDTRSVPN